MAGGYPIVLDLSGKLIVVIGGGNVALRKVRGLLACGATRIRIVSPVMHSEMPLDATNIRPLIEHYRPEHLSGAALVFAATDSAEVNDGIVAEARKIGALVCRADVDEDHAGDFATPAMIREGELLITVSSGGSPALSALIRDQISSAIDPNWTKMAQAMRELRPMIRGSLPAAQRKQAFRDLCSDDAFGELSRGGVAALKRWLIGKYPQMTLPDQTEQGN